jgi:ferredoxin
MLLNKQKWTEFTGILSGKKVLAPVACGDRFRYAVPAEGKAFSLDFDRPLVPPKSAVFPQTETLYRFQLGKTELAAPQPGEELILLGVRPCDARAIKLVEKLFRWDVDDPYYLRRRELTTVVGLACLEPGLNCFCPSLGGGPASTEGLDLLMVDLGDSYYLEPLTDKGRSLMDLASGLLEEAGEEGLQKKEEAVRRAEEKIRRTVDTDGVPEILPDLWEHPLWQKTAAGCLGCGTCTYLCPTCHCFDIQDEIEGFEARRCRMWDSCMFEEYTLHTSGHNPRPTRRERTRNRINHKYSYFVRKFNVIACVGCGRCVNYCPVNIDLIETLREVKEAQ